MNENISVIIPTFCEADNLIPLIQAIDDVLSSQNYEVLLMDDNSPDNSAEITQQLSQNYPLKLITRLHNHGLALAVIDGFKQAQGDYIVVMDADLSHPAKTIVEMVDLLATNRADFVIGSRFVKGGKIDGSWHLGRHLNSKIATFLSSLLVKAKDPMSGFFAFRKIDCPPLKNLNPIGYKIGLELMVKGNFKHIVELPIFFKKRTFGKSKLNTKEQWNYLRHLHRLYQFAYPRLSELFQFGLVGLNGMVVDLCVYLLAQWLFASPHMIARIVSFWFAASANWLFNRKTTFKTRLRKPKIKQWLAFISTSSLGFVVNVGSYYLLTTQILFFYHYPLIAFFIGIGLGFFLNFLLASKWVFKST